MSLHHLFPTPFERGLCKASWLAVNKWMAGSKATSCPLCSLVPSTLHWAKLAHLSEETLCLVISLICTFLNCWAAATEYHTLSNFRVTKIYF